jgi:hypothetical protein
MFLAANPAGTANWYEDGINTARLRIFGGDFEDVETRYIASLQGFGFL